jgi:hypothetical protein
MPHLGIPWMTITARAKALLRRATFRAKLDSGGNRLAARFAHGFGFGLGGVGFDLFGKTGRCFFDAGLKFADRFAHRLADLRQLAGPKDQERDDENNNQVSGLQSKHRNLLSARQSYRITALIWNCNTESNGAQIQKN